MTPTRSSNTARQRPPAGESVLGALTLAVAFPLRLLAHELRSSCPRSRAAAIQFHGDAQARRPAAL